MNYTALEQAREAIKQKINEHKETIIVYRKQLVADGFGGYVEDPYGISEPVAITCRISKNSRTVEDYKTSTVGLDVTGSWFILTDYKTKIYENDTFEAREKKWKVGAVTQIKKYGGVIAYEALLTEAESAEGET